jgi:hypothetical protein
MTIRPDYSLHRSASAADEAERGRRIEQLRSLRLTGRVVSDFEEGWNLARQAWNLAADQRPPLVAFPETADDVIKLIGFATTHGMQVAPQGTGHGAGPLGKIENAVLIRPTRMNAVAIDPRRRRARVGAGATWREVQVAAEAHGLAGLAGSSLEVGVLGYTMGGGLGWLGRRYGLACNSVVAFDMVTANGRLLHVDHKHEPDLFWALRGGGGNFGVVTALEFELYPVRELYAGALYWPQERAGEILRAWRSWTDSVPSSVTSVGRLLNLPDSPEIPEGVRGRSFVVIEAACLATPNDGTDLLQPLRALGPAVDTFANVRPTDLDSVHMDPVEPTPAYIDGALLMDADSTAIDALVEVAGSASGSQLLSVELRHLGAALAQAAPEHGALGSIEARFAAVTISLVPDSTQAASVDLQAEKVRTTLKPWMAERNFPNFAERASSPADIHSAETIRRLVRVKAQYDPRNLTHSPHPIPTA